MNVSIHHILTDDSRYPPALKTSSLFESPHRLSFLGNFDILQPSLLGMFCSVRCPGDLVLKTYDVAQHLRDSGATVISGFHTPMEKEAFDVLMRGDQPIVVCPARSLNRMRVPVTWRSKIQSGQMLVLSPFEDRHMRVTAALSELRNRFVATLAQDVLVVHANPNGKTAVLAQDVIAAGKIVYTLESDANAHLIAVGAKVLRLDEVGKL